MLANSVHDYSCYRDCYYEALKHLIGPFWMADLLYLWQRHLERLKRRLNPAALQRLLEGADRDPTDYSWLYYKYHWGWVLPGPKRVTFWLSGCDAAERAPKLLLWDVLNPKPLDDFVATEVWDCLAPEVKCLAGPSGWSSAWKLRQLVGLCQTDALTVLLMLIRRELAECRPKGSPKRASLLIPYAREAFFRLSVFPPFQQVRQLFYQYLGPLAFTLDYKGKRIHDPGPDSIITEEIDVLIRSMEGLGKMGLLGLSLDEQIRFVNWYRSHIDEETKRSISSHVTANHSVVLPPSDPLWQALKRLRHPGTRKGRPIELPWKGQWISDFRIANVLGEAEARLPKRKNTRNSSIARQHVH